MNPQAIAAFDLGSKTGWAMWREGRPIAHGVNPNRQSSRDSEGMVYLNFDAFLVRLYAAHPFDVAYYEDVKRHEGTYAAHFYGALRGELLAFCVAQEVEYEGVPVGTIKKWATGNGNAKKVAMRAAMEAKHGKLSSDDEADALATLGWALEKHGIRV